MAKLSPYFTFLRQEILPLIPDATKRMLSLGCGAALTEGKFRQTHDCHVTGIELDRTAADDAKNRIDTIVHGNVETAFESVTMDPFDCILAMDILEHLDDPWKALRKYANLLTDDGVVIASIPNINHHSIRSRLAFDLFPYEKAGILDRTHKRFFTLTEIYKLFAYAGLKIIETNPFKTRADSYQYIIKAVPLPRLKSEPTTTIVIPTLNNLAYTKACVSSLRANTRLPYRLIVVDNGSNDGTVTWLKQQPDILYIPNVANLGFAVAVNQGIDCVTTEYFVIANNDILFSPDWLYNLSAHIDDEDNVGLIGPMTNFCSGPQQINDPPPKTAEDLDCYARRQYNATPGAFKLLPRLVFFCCLIKKAVYDIIGGLDERFLIGNFEDDDYCRRACVAGFKCVMAHDVYILHFGHTTFKSEKINLPELLKINQKKFLDKWGGK